MNLIDSLNRIVLKTDRGVFWLSSALCLSLCLIIIFVISPLTGLSKNFSGNDGYIQIAENLVRGNGYVFEKDGSQIFHRPPFYPLFLVPVAIFPVNWQRFVLIFPQSLLVGLISLLIFKIAKRCFNLSVARIAVIIFLINPWVYWNAKNPMTQILQGFLYAAFVWLVGNELFPPVKTSETQQSGGGPLLKSAVIGATSAAIALTHAAMLVVVVVNLFIVSVVAITQRRKQLFLTFISAGVIAIVLIAPWTYRNWVVFHRFIPIAGGGGLAYFNGNVHWSCIEEFPQRPGESYIDASIRVLGIDGTEKTHTHWKGFKDIKYEELADKKMAEHIRNHPVPFMEKFILNAIEFYFPAFVKPFLAIKTITSEQIVLSIFHLVLWVAAGVSIFSCWRKSLLLLAGIFIYAVWYFPFATGFIAHSPYTFGTIPLLSILAAKGLTTAGNIR